MMLVETTSVWQNLKRVLRLIDDRINVARPDDISYVSAGNHWNTVKNMFLSKFW
jgi:hypothetical protein